MVRKYKLKNEKEQHLAVVYLFFQKQFQKNIGIIIKCDMSNEATSLYENEKIEDIITDLANKLDIVYSSIERLN